jgi:hypothetical protein
VAKEDTAHFELSAALQETAAPGVVQGSVAVVQFPFSKTYTPVGSKFTEGTAKGTVTVFNKSSQAVALIPKTRFQTGSGTLFRLLKRADIPAGGQATVDVYADAPGKDGDIGPSDFILPALSADQQKVIFAKSDKPMIGGSTAIGVVTTDDIAAAQNDFSQKAQAEFVARGLGVNLPEDLKTLASVADTKTVVDKAVGSEASQFTVSGTSTIVIINYHVSDVKRLIQSEINRKTAASAIKILSLNQEVPTVMVASFDLAAKTAQLTLSQDALVTVDSANDALDPMRFTNKTREQIQSQINSLEYVAGSEVTFSPQFLMRTSPNLSDKIKVVVKNIK